MTGVSAELAYLIRAVKNERARDRRNGVRPPPDLPLLIEFIAFRVTEGQEGSPLVVTPGRGEPVTVAPIAVRYETAALMLEVSVSTVKRLVRAGRLPVVRVEKSPRIRVVDLEAYLSEAGDHP